MQSKPGIRQIAPDSVSRLPWLAPPAGYVVLIQDAAYGNRYKIARLQQLDRRQIERGADFPFETRVVLIQEATDAAAAERDLHDELAPGTAIGEWFDRVHLPQARPSSPSRHSSVSLGDLVRNDDGADSLLEDSKIVDTGAKAPAPQTFPARERRTARRRRRPAARWAIALGLLVVAGFFVAERSGEIQRIIESLLDEGPQQTVSPTPTVEGRGEVFFTTTNAGVRICAAVSCRVVGVLNPGTRITARKYVKGQGLNGSTRWMAFVYRGELRYMHDSVLSRSRLAAVSSPEPSPTVEPTQIPTTVERRDKVFYLTSNANARLCARMSCAAGEFLPRGTRIVALRYVEGQALEGSDRWIKFVRGGELVYIHSGRLSQDEPESQFKLTALAGSTGETFYLRIRARARACARLSCETGAILPPGTAIKVKGHIIGQTLDGNNRWVVFDHGGRNLYIHRTLLTRDRSNIEAIPQPSATAPRATAKPTAIGENEIFYVNTEVRARTCARLTCSEAQLLFPGMKIVALRYTKGQAIDGNDRWIRFINRGWFQYVHSRYLSRERPAAKPPTATEPPPTRRPLRAEYASADGDQVYFVKTGVKAKVLNCAKADCVKVGTLAPGTRVEARQIVRGQTINGSAEWISFYYDGWYRFVHSGDLFPLKPQATATTAAADLPTATEPPPADEPRSTEPPPTDEPRSTEPPPTDEPRSTEPPPADEPTETEPPPADEPRSTEPPPTDEPTETEPPPTASPTAAPPETAIVETAGNVNANIRACPRTSCAIVAKFAAGAEVEILDRVRGETVYETDIWLEIKFEGGSAFLHSELIAEAS